MSPGSNRPVRSTDTCEHSLKLWRSRSLTMQQIEIEPPFPVVVGIKGCRLSGGVWIFAVDVIGLAAEAIVTLDILEHDILNEVQISQAENEGTTTTEDHSFCRALAANIRCDSLRERNQNLLDLPALTTSAEGRPHGVDLDAWNVTVIRPTIAEESHL